MVSRCPEGHWKAKVMRRRPRLDKNHAAIVDALRKAGCQVLSLAGLGGGVPDLLVFKNGHLVLFEVKSPGGKLTEDQEAFHSHWPVLTVDSPALAVELATWNWDGGQFPETFPEVSAWSPWLK